MRSVIPKKAFFALMSKLPKVGIWIAVAAVVFVWSSPSFAALGDTLQSVQMDQARIGASLKVIRSDAFTVYEMRSATGTVIREYISESDGRVFGVSWQGPFTPDLRQLLGVYFQQYSQAVKAQRESHVGRGFLEIHEAGLVVRTAGHMRAYSGLAYDPELLPNGVNADDIQ